MVANTLTNNVFPAAAGWSNLPNGDAFPLMFSKELIMFNREISVVNEITNSSYFGEITGVGSQVEVLKEPSMDVQDYVRGTEFDIQYLDDDAISVVIDQAKYFAFAVDDIEKKMSHIDWYSKAVASGAYKLADTYDTNVLSYIEGAAGSVANTGTSGGPINIGFDSSDTTPINYLGQCKLNLDKNATNPTDRFAVVSPDFIEKLTNEDSSLTDASYAGSNTYTPLQEAKFGANVPVKGFTIYMSNNLPADTDVIYGSKSATAAAQKMTESKLVEREKSFGQLYASMMVWGRKIIKEEDIFTGKVTFN